MSALTVNVAKDPADRLDYDVDYGARWLPTGDVIQSATATITGSTATADQVDVSSDAVKVWISGGAAGDTAIVTVRAVTAQGRTKEISFRLRIRES